MSYLYDLEPKATKNRTVLIFSRVHATLQVTLSVGRLVGRSVGRLVGWSVCRSVGLSHFAFFAFLGYLKVGKHIFEYFMS